MKKRRIRLKRRVAALLDLPEETLTGLVKVVMYADHALLVENHGGVFECACERVRFRTQLGILRVEGEGMVLMELSNERALVSAAEGGRITGAQFEK